MECTENHLSTEQDRALSPVIGVLLLVGVIVVALSVAAVFISASVPTLADDREVARFDVVYNGMNKSLDITHTGGKALYGRRVFIEDADGDRVNWSAVHPQEANAKVGVTIQVGEQTRFDELARPCAVPKGYEYTIVRYTRDGVRDELTTHEMAERSC